MLRSQKNTSQSDENSNVHFIHQYLVYQRGYIFIRLVFYPLLRGIALVPQHTDLWCQSKPGHSLREGLMGDYAVLALLLREPWTPSTLK